uniref:Zinc finger protein 772 n=1 Tax=Panthera leo TaxID=9689 RepID=A0A8C8Y3H8_PANLE
VEAAPLTDEAQVPTNSEVIMDPVQVLGMERRTRRQLLSRTFLW